MKACLCDENKKNTQKALQRICWNEHQWWNLLQNFVNIHSKNKSYENIFHIFIHVFFLSFQSEFKTILAKAETTCLGIIYIEVQIVFLPTRRHLNFFSPLFSPVSEHLLNLSFSYQIFHQILSCLQHKNRFSLSFFYVGAVMILSDEEIFQLPWIFFLESFSFSAFGSKIHSLLVEASKICII